MSEENEKKQWVAEFEAAARRPLRQRFRYAFIRTYSRSSTTANRAKDRESLPRLIAFRDYWKSRR